VGFSDYFAAATDELAADAVDAGPGGTYDMVDAKGVNPANIGELEELLTGRPYEEILQDPAFSRLVAIRDEGGRLVLGVTDTLTRSLAGADAERLAEVAGPWAATFWGNASADDILPILTDLAALAGRAVQRGEHLYSWECV
jgi:hypothetical protein